jgi:hypothetical protein
MIIQECSGFAGRFIDAPHVRSFLRQDILYISLVLSIHLYFFPCGYWKGPKASLHKNSKDRSNFGLLGAMCGMRNEFRVSLQCGVARRGLA